MGDTTSAAEFLNEVEEIQVAALQQVTDSQEHLEKAKQMHEEALLLAHRAGCSNTAIARAAGKTETAIRLWFKRRKMSPEARRAYRKGKAE